jgi:exodeoxyribonuclease V beta subunit
MNAPASVPPASAPERDLALRLPLSGVRLVEASAGTGKTFALTAWILRLLLARGVPLPQLLVVTFTRAATAELRERIRRRLRGAERLLAGEAPRDDEQRQTQALIARAIDEQAQADGEATVRARLAAALVQLDEASVSTIHGFCQRALREFGFIAGSIGDETVIDDPREAWDAVAADLWRSANFGPDAGAAHLRTLWSTPAGLAGDLPGLCDPARRLLPAADASDLAAWLHALRAEARTRFDAELARRHQRSQDQLLERMHAAMGDARFAAAVSARWPVALVDEFQDTDPQQWAIFRDLYEAGGARARGHGADHSDAQPPLLGLVGDPKQAIYAFRGGDLGTYLAARDYVREHGGEDSLDINYRSRPAVLGAIQALFTQNDRPFRSDIAFHPVVAARVADEDALSIGGVPPPGLSVHWLPAPADAAKNKRPKDDDVRDAIAVTVAEIVRLLEHGELRDDGHVRRVRASDIAVLVRKNKQVTWVRDALAAAGIGAATQGNDSVFASEAAGEVHRLLEACAHPGDAARVRAALATRLIGLDAAAIAALDDSALADGTPALPAWQASFETAGLTWQQRGPLPALLPFLDGQYLDGQHLGEDAAAARLAQAGGTRLLTDALHLAERLQAQGEASHGMHALLRWFAQQCVAPPQSDDLALRLDADADAVQVLTLHKAKGLEYPVVFLPFTAFADDGGGNGGLCRSRVRDDDGTPASYFHLHRGTGKARSMVLGDPARHDAWLAQEDDDACAEDLRLLYVGLTRARHALHVTWGHTYDSNASALQWLLHGDAKAGRKSDALQPDGMRARIERLARDSQGAIVVRPIPSPVPPAVLASDVRARDGGTPQARVATAVLPRGGGQHSFSGLRGRHREALPARGADDEVAAATPADAATRLGGADFGNVVHDVLEGADFAAWNEASAAPGSACAAIRRALARHALPQTPEAVAQVGDLVARALNVPLPGTGTLACLPGSRRVAEMEFHFRLAPTRLPALYALLDAHGYPRATAAARAGSIEGLMHGYIDLLYRDDAGRHYVLDYKTNRLRDYTADACRQAVTDNDYDLQDLIYLVAVQRWLRLRLGAGYDPARDLGGAVYLFLRGLVAGDAKQGIHHDRPPQAVIDGMDALFDGAAR